MKSYKKIYIKFFDYLATDFIPCEVCGSRAVDIHHIECKGMGGSKKKDTIQNLMAVCRICHIEYGDKKQHLEWLQEIHKKKIEEQAT